MDNTKDCTSCGQPDESKCMDCKMTKSHVCVNGVCKLVVEPSNWEPMMEEESE